jgi:hypothetical protein
MVTQGTFAPTPTAFDLAEEAIRQRQWNEGIATLNVMADLYEGKLPSEYNKYFPNEEPKQVVNLVKLAWNDLAISIGRLPDLRSDPLNSSNEELKRVGMHEKIGFSYLNNSKPSGKQLMFHLAWWLVGGGRAVVVLEPDAEAKSPTFTIRDPRTCYPKAKRTAGNQIIELEDVLFKYELPINEMQARGLKTKSGDARSGFPTESEQQMGTVIEYLDDKEWVVMSDGGSVVRAEHGCGQVPVYVFQTFSPNKTYGLSQFQDQVNFMVSISRLLTQKLAFNDRLVWPITWIKGHQGKIKIGPHVINKLSPQGEMGQIAPSQAIQIDRDIEQLTQFSRILNRNPEVRQGEVTSKGTYTSAKTLEQLAESIDTVIGVHWDLISIGMEYLFKLAYKMDERLWGNVQKTTTGVIKGNAFRVDYTPNKNINGRYGIHVEYGFGVGGYQGFLQQLQALEAKTTSRRRAIEQMPGTHDADAVIREIELEQMDDSGHAAFAAQAAQGTLDVLLWAKIRKTMAKKGMPLNDAILKYTEEIQQQAVESQAAGPQGSEALTAPPVAQEGAAPGGGLPLAQQPLPGLPPQELV